MDKKVQDYPDDVLLKKLRSQRVILGLYIIIITILAFCSLILTMKKGIIVFILMPFVFMFFLFKSLKEYNKLREEIKKRKLN